MDKKLFNNAGKVKMLFQKSLLLLLICFFIVAGMNINVTATDQPNTRDILAALHRRLDTLQDYQHQNIYIRNRNGVNVTEGYNYFFKKPNLIRLEVTAGKDKGSLAILTATGKVRAHAGGVLGIFKVTMEPNDKRLQNEDGFTIADSGFQKIIKEIETRLTGNSKSNVVEINREKKLYQLQIERGNFREQILIDMQTSLPIEWLTNQNGQFYGKSEWHNWKVNSGLPDSLFEL
jgi:outer membrane lipoprotein-sorting protein